MKRFTAILALTCALSASVIAGDIPTTGFAPPAPLNPTETATVIAPGEIPTVGSADSTTKDEVLKGILNLLSLLAP